MSEEAAVVNSVDLAKLKVADLKRELKNRGLLTTGNKTELLERLQLALHGDGSLVLESDSVVVDAEEMLDDDDVLADDPEEVLDSEILKTPTDAVSPQLPLKSSTEDLTKIEKQPAKKIVLNRTTVPTVGKENQEAAEKPEKKIIKLSQLTTKERLEMRSQKFGGMANVSEEAKKAARAERFGITPVVTSAGAKKTVTASSDALSKRAARFGITAPAAAAKGATVEVLKKRAERFGQSVSSTLEKVDQEERLRKRKERFGVVEPKKMKTPLG
ncbi:SAP domain-containing ribonucleoprotein [Ischnura elegans]|uniref:SAP domain-containing ribonucleoprotein n=1 Tax=Ischnura elegans TaxID=197161 RepID=UPI001ED891A0|nr:SAP domain-containing ribonucleoprotein [Ischnura elegans]